MQTDHEFVFVCVANVRKHVSCMFIYRHKHVFIDKYYCVILYFVCLLYVCLFNCVCFCLP